MFFWFRFVFIIIVFMIVFMRCSLSWWYFFGRVVGRVGGVVRVVRVIDVLRVVDVFYRGIVWYVFIFVLIFYIIDRWVYFIIFWVRYVINFIIFIVIIVIIVIFIFIWFWWIVWSGDRVVFNYLIFSIVVWIVIYVDMIVILDFWDLIMLDFWIGRLMLQIWWCFIRFIFYGLIIFLIWSRYLTWHFFIYVIGWFYFLIYCYWMTFSLIFGWFSLICFRNFRVICNWCGMLWSWWSYLILILSIGLIFLFFIIRVYLRFILYLFRGVHLNEVLFLFWLCMIFRWGRLLILLLFWNKGCRDRVNCGLVGWDLNVVVFVYHCPGCFLSGWGLFIRRRGRGRRSRVRLILAGFFLFMVWLRRSFLWGEIRDYFFEEGGLAFLLVVG